MELLGKRGPVNMMCKFYFSGDWVFIAGGNNAGFHFIECLQIICARHLAKWEKS